jgi:hypothetical protein
MTVRLAVEKGETDDLAYQLRYAFVTYTVLPISMLN